jgi:hypothetical protein
MKYIHQFIALLTVVFCFTACEKDKHQLYELSNLNIINSIFGGTAAKLNSQSRNIPVNLPSSFSLRAGNNRIYVFPNTDSLHPYYDSSIVTHDKEGYSLFLTGNVSNIESVLIKEDLPYHTDSVAGIRFINLAANMPAVNITLSTTPTVNEANDLAYKQYTGFKTYPGLYNSSYVFQVRNAASPTNPIATYSLTSANVPRFANITLAIVQTATGVSVIRANNDR